LDTKNARIAKKLAVKYIFIENALFNPAVEPQ